MGTGWRRAFCTTAPRNSDAAAPDLGKQHTSPSPRSCVKLSFLSGGSNPSTPRPRSAPSLRCRTTNAETPTAEQISTPRSTTKTPRPSLTACSNPSSPRSPLKLSLFRNSFKFRSSCRICLNSVKTGQGTAKYTAECSHAFHFPCISDHVSKHGKLVCPVCNSLWKDASLLAPHRNTTESPCDDAVSTVVVRPKFYDDDDPLLSPRFVTIRETDTNDGDFGNVQVSLLPESAVVSVVCGYETRVVSLRVKASPPPLASGGGRRRLLDPLQRAPVDLVIVVDIAGIGNAAKLQMVKRAMRLVVSSLGSADRFSIVASGARLLPLKRMTNHGKRSAGAVVDGLLCCGQASNTSDALKKAARVLEDRRETNPIASIVLLSDGQSQLTRVNTNQRSIIEIPVTEYGFGDSHAPPEESFTKCIKGLLSVVVQDLRIQIRVGSGSGPCEISAVYLCNGRPALVSSASGSVRLGDLYAGEERDLLVELRIPSTSSMTGSQQVLSVRGLYKDPSTQEVVYGRDQSLRVPQSERSSTSPRTERLKSLFIMTRAVTEARRLVEYGECTSAHHLLTSALALLGRSGTAEEEAAVYAKVVEAELVEVEWRRQQFMEYQSQQQQHVQRRRGSERRDMTMMLVDENGEPLTPTSTWRAAEKLAMKKKSDLHGFENARF